jgi:xylulokinase
MNMKVELIESEEGPGYGAAILAAVGCGVFPSVETAAKKLVKVISTVEPEAELAEKYERKYREFQKYYPALKAL